MYCRNCGAQIDDKAVICPHCGVPTDNYYAAPPHSYNQTAPQTAPERDEPNTGFAVLGFFFPIVGLILYLVWMHTMPLRAKSCGKGALIGVITEVALSVLIIIMVVVTTLIIYGPTISLFATAAL